MADILFDFLLHWTMAVSGFLYLENMDLIGPANLSES